MRSILALPASPKRASGAFLLFRMSITFICATLLFGDFLIAKAPAYDNGQWDNRAARVRERFQHLMQPDNPLGFLLRPSRRLRSRRFRDRRPSLCRYHNRRRRRRRLRVLHRILSKPNLRLTTDAAVDPQLIPLSRTSVSDGPLIIRRYYLTPAGGASLAQAAKSGQNRDGIVELFAETQIGLNSMPNLPFAMRFGATGDYKLWAGEGWHDDPNDKEHVWAGHIAKLRLMLEYVKNDLLLQIDVIPVQAKGVEQELFVFLNGRFAAFWPVKQPSERSARIEASLFVSGENLFTFVAPKAICPKELGLGTDQRILGLAFRTFSLSAAR